VTTDVVTENPGNAEIELPLAPQPGRRIRIRLAWTVPAAGLLAALAGAGLSGWAAVNAPLDELGDLGLAAVLGPAYWAGLVLLNVAFGIGLFAARPRTWLLTLATGGLVLAVYGAAALASPIPRGQVAWRHLGIVDNLITTGHPDRAIDAYFSWPGFFALAASFFQGTGLPPIEVIRWAPVWNTVLWLLALGVLMRQLTGRARLAWLAVWLFAAADWIDQDYFSPQAIAFLLLVVVYAVVLHRFRAEPGLGLRAALRAGGGADADAAAAGRAATLWDGARRWWAARKPVGDDLVPSWQRAALLLALATLAAAMVVSHQLTPFALAAGLAVLAIAGCTSAPRLPLVVGLLTVAWLVYVAVPYLVGHPPGVGAGDVRTLATTNVLDRLRGTPGHLTIQGTRLVVTAAIVGLAVWGVLRARRAGKLLGGHASGRAAVALAAGPVLLAPLQSYGGEMLLRVTLYCLPLVAFFAAISLLPRPGVPGWARRVAIVAVCTLLAAGAVTSRYGNAAFDMFRPDEIRAADVLYEYANPGDVLLAGARATPWRYRDYGEYRTVTLEDLCIGVDTQTCFQRVRSTVYRASTGRGLLLVTRSNGVSLDATGQLPAEQLAEFEGMLLTRPGVRILWQTADARIYELTHLARE